MHARQIRRKYLQRTFTRNAETLYSSQYRNIIIIANVHETVKGVVEMEEFLNNKDIEVS